MDLAYIYFLFLAKVLTFTCLSLYASTLSNELEMIERLEAKEIAEAEGVDKKNVLAVLIVVTNLLLADMVNEKSKFDQVIINKSGPINYYLSGEVIDKEGVGTLIVSSDDGTPDQTYTGGIITGKAFYEKGTTVVLTAIDKKGDVTIETRVME